jgi:hypothetical protein
MLSFISGSQCVNPQASPDNKKIVRVNCGLSYPTLGMASASEHVQYIYIPTYMAGSLKVFLEGSGVLNR